MGNRGHTEEVRIEMFHRHFAYIDIKMKSKIESILGSEDFKDFIKRFIKNKVISDFGLELKTKQDIDSLDVILKENFYKDKADWIREELRTYIKESESERNEKYT